MLKRIFFPIFALSVVVAVYAGDQPSTQPARPESNSSQHDDFPFAISFEQGATQFQSWDQITITEVRGTSSDMQSGICRISGTYTLASHDKATLAASVTARELADGSGPWNRAQTLTITRGHGNFTLMLPISVRGWPHVSFYGASSDFGGSYIGTGDSVLRHWWGS
jgi:hypothetical protein